MIASVRVGAVPSRAVAAGVAASSAGEGLSARPAVDPATPVRIEPRRSFSQSSCSDGELSGSRPSGRSAEPAQIEGSAAGEGSGPVVVALVTAPPVVFPPVVSPPVVSPPVVAALVTAPPVVSAPVVASGMIAGAVVVPSTFSAPVVVGTVTAGPVSAAPAVRAAIVGDRGLADLSAPGPVSADSGDADPEAVDLGAAALSGVMPPRVTPTPVTPAAAEMASGDLSAEALSARQHARMGRGVLLWWQRASVRMSVSAVAGWSNRTRILVGLPSGPSAAHRSAVGLSVRIGSVLSARPGSSARLGRNSDGNEPWNIGRDRYCYEALVGARPGHSNGRVIDTLAVLSFSLDWREERAPAGGVNRTCPKDSPTDRERGPPSSFTIRLTWSGLDRPGGRLPAR